MSPRFTTDLKVRFGHEDHAQLVYYPKFFDFFHQAFEDFFEAELKPYREVLVVDRLGWPAVHAEADFRAPLRFGDVLRLSLWVTRVGERSVSFAYEGRRKADDTLVVTGATTVVCVSMDGFAPRSIPEEYRSLFARLEA